MSHLKTLKDQTCLLLEKAGLDKKILSLSDCIHGGNNRTYKIETPDGIFVVKKYFRQNNDLRDRLSAEFTFLSYAKKIIPHMVPTPYSYDQAFAIALYEYIEGTPLTLQDVSEKEISQAIHFFCALNEPQHKMQATELPLASEACFTLAEHLDLVTTRIKALQKLIPDDMEDKSAQKLVTQMSIYWRSLLNAVKRMADIEKIDLYAPLQHTQRAVSPSDFGFHNALKVKDGTIRFLDFEYAGLDDPAKMAGDFFSQLAIPVPIQYFDNFVKKAMAPFPHSDYLIRRAHLLKPVYQVKWFCIALNIFIPVNLERRRFANPGLDVHSLKRMQLSKAELLLQKLQDF